MAISGSFCRKNTAGWDSCFSCLIGACSCVLCITGPYYALQHRRGRRAAMSAPGTPPEAPGAPPEAPVTPPEAPGTPPESMLLWELEAIVNNKDGFFLIERQG